MWSLSWVIRIVCRLKAESTIDRLKLTDVTSVHDAESEDELAPLIKESESCDFVVAIEKHNNPAYPERDTHIHALWFASKKTDSRNSRHFDLKGRGGRPLHPFMLIPDANGDGRVRQNC
jgi:hypothetical protein